MLPVSTKGSQSFFLKFFLFDFVIFHTLLQKNVFIKFHQLYGDFTSFKFEFEFPANFHPLDHRHLFKINLKSNFQTLLSLNYEYCARASSRLRQNCPQPCA